MVENIITTTSYRNAILIRISKGGAQVDRRPVQTGFRFEAAWLRAPDRLQRYSGEVLAGGF